MLELKIEPSVLIPLVREIVAAILAEQAQAAPMLNGRLAFSEPEAAELLGLNSWQLRDLRIAKKIGFTRIVGNRVRYTPEQLRAYLSLHSQPGTP